MALSILAVDAAASSLLSCVCAGLSRLPTEVPGLDGCPCRSCVVPGTPAADNCGEGCERLPAGEFPGQLTVNVVRIYSSDRQNFPREVQTVRDLKDCPPPQTTAVELNITLYRCVPGSTNEGCPPTCEALSASAMQVHADLLAIQRAVLCCYAGTDTTRPRGRRYVLGASRVVGPQGDCVGIEQRVVTALDDCLACPVTA
jgi:hypothetical protein